MHPLPYGSGVSKSLRVSRLVLLAIAIIPVIAGSIPRATLLAQPSTLTQTVFNSAGWTTFGLALPANAAAGASVQVVGADATQTDVKNRWPNGNIRFAVVTAKIVNPGPHVVVSGAPGATLAAVIPGTWPDASVSLNINGTAWTAALPAGAPMSDMWLDGPLVREGRKMIAPLANGAPHPFLRVIFDARVYADGESRVDVTVENSIDVEEADAVEYDVAINVGGSAVFAQTGVMHGFMARWRHVYSSPGFVEAGVASRNFDSFVAAGAIPRFLPDSDTSGAADSSGPDFGIVSPCETFEELQVCPAPEFGTAAVRLGTGDLHLPLNDHGHRPEIAPYPDFAAAALVNQRPDLVRYMLKHGDISGHLGIHIRDTDGKPINIDDRPDYWTDGRGDDKPANSQDGFIMGQATPPDNAHVPSLAYVPYLYTGDRFYNDEMQFLGDYALLNTYQDRFFNARGGGKDGSWQPLGPGSLGVLSPNEVRGIAWTFRNITDAAAYTPDGEPSKARYTEKLQYNLSLFDHAARTEDTPLGTVFTPHRPEDNWFPPFTWIALWEHEYVAWAFDHAGRQGFSGGEVMRDRIAAFQLELLTSTDQGYPRAYAGPGTLAVGTRDGDTFTFYEALDEAFHNSYFDTSKNELDPPLPFSGRHGISARLMLLQGIQNKWQGSEEALEYLMTVPEFFDGMPVEPMSDFLRSRPGWNIAAETPDPDLPTIVNPGPQTRNVGDSVTLNITATDDDGAPTFEALFLPAGLSINSATGQITGVLTTPGVKTTMILVTDSQNKLATMRFRFTVSAGEVVRETTITSSPSALTNSATAEFTFNSTIATDSFECDLDATGSFTACANPYVINGLADGPHSLAVRATDGIGSIDSTAAVYEWTVDTTPPDTTILTAPAALSNVVAAMFAFASEPGATFECSLDGGAFGACASPYTVGQGPHTFQVRATDQAGNSDPSPAAHSWTVDSIAPDTAITSGPPALTTSPTASFAFSSEPDATFECSLDGAAFGACASPYTVGEGPHTFRVRATDQAGNTDATPAIRNWTVDSVAPETTITNAPAALSNSTIATFTFSSEALATFQCSLDGAAFGACASPYTVGQGAHTFQVRATDQAGNTDATPATHAWTVDSIAPDTLIVNGPPPVTNNATAAFTFSSEADATFQCRLDSGVFGPCAASYTLSDGSHTFFVRATDAAGNTDPTPASRTWSIDTVAPVLTLASVSATAPTADGVNVTYTASAIDPTHGPVAAVCLPPSGSHFDLGTTPVLCTASDAAGNASAGSFLVTVALPPNTVSDAVTASELDAAGGQVTVTTAQDSDAGATPSQPAVVSLTTSTPGTVTLTTGTPSAPPASYSFVGQQVSISVTPSPGAPYVIAFEIDETAVAGLALDDIAIFRNGVAVQACTTLPIGPDPCVASREVMEDNDVLITVHSTAGSIWNAAIPAATANHRPTLEKVHPQHDREGDVVSLQLVGDDVDGDTLEYSAVGLPPGLSIDENSGLIHGTLTKRGLYVVLAVVSDGQLSAKRVFPWFVERGNRAPEIEKPKDQKNDIGDKVVLKVKANDPDDHDNLQFSAVDLPPGLSIDERTGIISGKPTTAGVYPVTVGVSDGSLSDTATFVWTVSARNRAPVVTSPGKQSNRRNATVTLQIVASDPDGDALVFEADDLPEGLRIGRTSGLIEGTIECTQPGTHHVVIKVSDGRTSTSVKFDWVILPNGKPAAVNPGPQMNRVGDSVNLQIMATDPDGDEIEYSAVELPAGLKINKKTGVISGTIDKKALNIGTHKTEVIASDGRLRDVIGFSWKVVK